MEDDHPSAPTAPSKAECLTFVKVARYTALTADRLSGDIVSFLVGSDAVPSFVVMEFDSRLFSNSPFLFN
jgi:hypothetical protein